MPFRLSSNLARPFGRFAGLSAETFPGSDKFEVEKQLMSNWCWAACTIMVCRFYQTNDQLTQREFVAEMLQNPICSNNMPHPVCNRTFDFDSALNHVKHLGEIVDNIISPTDLIQRLKTNGPVGCKMEIPDVGGHAVLIVHATDGTENSQFVTVADPSDGSLLTMPYKELRDNFRGTGGFWVRSFNTMS